MLINDGMNCTVSGRGDLFMDVGMRPFINSECKIVKITKSGLVQVCLVRDTRRLASVPKRNIAKLVAES